MSLFVRSMHMGRTPESTFKHGRLREINQSINLRGQNWKEEINYMVLPYCHRSYQRKGCIPSWVNWSLEIIQNFSLIHTNVFFLGIFTQFLMAGGRTLWWDMMMPSVKCAGGTTSFIQHPGTPQWRYGGYSSLHFHQLGLVSEFGIVVCRVVLKELHMKSCSPVATNQNCNSKELLFTNVLVLAIGIS